jgi:hypothetical protein
MMSGAFALPRRSIAVVLASALVSLLRWLILVVIALLLAPHVLAHAEQPRGHAATAYVLRQSDVLVQQASRWLRLHVPTRIAGRDRTDWILMMGLSVLAIGAGSMRDGIVRRATARQLRQQLTYLAEAKRRFDARGREVAFLSIDGVGSTGMTERKDSAESQHDFSEYRTLVEAVFGANDILKSAWTPNGVMGCFPDTERAIAAGKAVILRLGDFQDGKQTHEAFAVRCGVSADYVEFDEAMPLEAMSDRAIDLARYIRKCAEPNTVAVAHKVSGPLPHPAGFMPAGGGYQVACWKSRAGRSKIICTYNEECHYFVKLST